LYGDRAAPELDFRSDALPIWGPALQAHGDASRPWFRCDKAAEVFAQRTDATSVPVVSRSAREIPWQTWVEWNPTRADFLEGAIAAIPEQEISVSRAG